MKHHKIHTVGLKAWFKTCLEERNVSVQMDPDLHARFWSCSLPECIYVDRPLTTFELTSKSIGKHPYGVAASCHDSAVPHSCLRLPPRCLRKESNPLDAHSLARISHYLSARDMMIIELPNWGRRIEWKDVVGQIRLLHRDSLCQ
jgi:hypothetical protein